MKFLGYEVLWWLVNAGVPLPTRAWGHKDTDTSDALQIGEVILVPQRWCGEPWLPASAEGREGSRQLIVGSTEGDINLQH